MKDITATQIRIPNNLYEQVKKSSDEVGVSINAHIMELIYWGLKARDGSIAVYQKPCQEK